jgi:tetratricopeptide (TPR) repeat protein
MENLLYEVIKGTALLLSVIVIALLIFKKKTKGEEASDQLIKFYIRKKDFLRAGLLYEKKGEIKNAISMYEKAGAYGLMLKLGEKHGLKAEEAKARSFLEDHESAGQIYEDLRNFKKAFEEYVKAGRMRKAMECAKKGGIDFFPAEAVEENGGYEKVFFWELKRGNTKRALDVGKILFREKFNLLPEELRASNPFLKRIAEVMGEICEKENLHAEAGRFYLFAGLLSKSAEAYELSGDKRRAGELFFQARDFYNSRRIFEEIGDAEMLKRIDLEIAVAEKKFHDAGRLAEEIGDFRRAAQFYEIAGNYLKTGEMLLKSGEFLKAADMFEKAGNLVMAAEAFEKGKNFKKAAEVYKKLGNKKREIECYLAGGDFFSAGITSFEVGDLDNAMKYLQKVPPDSSEYSKASELLGIIFAEKGLYTQSIERLKNLLKDLPCEPSTIRAYYALGISYQAVGNVKSALSVFEKILAIDINYRDVPQRVHDLKQMLTPSSRREFESLAETKDLRRKEKPVEKYEIIEEIGRGGMGIVYKARDKILDRIVALKVLPQELASNKEAVESFIKEAKACASLIHPNIVTVYEAGFFRGSLFISMEYIDGPSIKELLDKGERLNYKYVVFVAGQVCKGLDFAHSKRIIHRDIKPGNIMLTSKKVVKIVDFGLAKVIEEVRKGYTVASGTPYYMSPEQTLGEEVDHRTDIYSLGITMYEMLTGEPPFTGGDVGYHHIHTPPPPIREFVPDVPPRLEAIVLKCLEKKPEKRFQSAKELFFALREVYKG